MTPSSVVLAICGPPLSHHQLQLPLFPRILGLIHLPSGH